MPKQYSLTRKLRFYNWLFRNLLRIGVAPGNVWLLTVPGRKTGRPYSTPVTLIEHGGREWLVAPYGEVGWVRNARAAGQVQLSRGGRSDNLKITQLSPAQSAPILKAYVQKFRIVRPYFAAAPEAPVEAFAAEAAQHPVFELSKVV